MQAEVSSRCNLGVKIASESCLTGEVCESSSPFPLHFDLWSVLGGGQRLIWLGPTRCQTICRCWQFDMAKSKLPTRNKLSSDVFPLPYQMPCGHCGPMKARSRDVRFAQQISGCAGLRLTCMFGSKPRVHTTSHRRYELHRATARLYRSCYRLDPVRWSFASQSESSGIMLAS